MYMAYSITMRMGNIMRMDEKLFAKFQDLYNLRQEELCDREMAFFDFCRGDVISANISDFLDFLILYIEIELSSEF